MNSLTMQRYVIALNRGFKGSYRQFLTQNRAKEKFHESSPKKGAGRARGLEEHVVACLEIASRVPE